MDSRSRQALVNGGHLFFTDDSQASDLTNSATTTDALLEHIAWIVAAGFHLEVTAVKTDHHDDHLLGEHCHFNGYAIDCWPLTGPTPGAYLDADNPFFQQFLARAAASPNYHGTGLAGSAYTEANLEAAGHNAFEDIGDDHVHLAAQ